VNNRLSELLNGRRGEIAANWALKVQQSSPHYQTRSFEDIQVRSDALLKGLIAAVLEDEFGALEVALREVADLRAAQGFAAGEIQRALLLGCDVICPVIEAEFRDDARLLVWSVARVERAISRAVSLFGEAFRDAHGVPVPPDGPGCQGASDRRLCALVTALGYQCAAVDRLRRVTWCAESGEDAAHSCLRCGALFACTDATDCPVERAFAEGRAECGEGCEGCGVILAVPVKDDCGAVVEVLALSPAPN